MCHIDGEKALQMRPLKSADTNFPLPSFTHMLQSYSTKEKQASANYSVDNSGGFDLRPEERKISVLVGPAVKEGETGDNGGFQGGTLPAIFFITCPRCE